MKTLTYATTAALQTALAPLTIEQRVETQANLVGGAWTLAVPDSLVALIGTAPSQPQLVAQLVAAASGACAVIRTQIVPDPTHDDAYKNAAAIVGPSATVPTVDPAKTAFANLAAQNGAQPQPFATLVVAIASVSMQLSTALGALQTAAASATTASQLATALQAFQAALGSVVTAIGAAGVTIKAPAPITIVGINA